MPDRGTLFEDIDSRDPDRFVAHLADDVTMRFGNAEPVHGRDAVRATWASFCETVDGVRHSQINRWEVGDSTIVESDVTYTRRDSTTVTVPVVTIYRCSGGTIVDYRVFIDLAPLFA